MAGVSESPFRRLCRRFGADVVVTEFLSAEGIRRENEATLSKLRFSEDERTIGVQIFGADPEAMRDAAALVTDIFQPEFIDINFGCPVKKVVRRNGGSGCLKDLDLVQQVIRAVISGTHLPVTCKIRSGWNEEMRDPVTIGLRCQDAGVKAIALHPRTRTQMYSGHAHWDEIAALVEALDIPVIGNGDIKTADDAARMRRETNCAAVMIARGSFGQPWIFDQARALIEGDSCCDSRRIAATHLTGFAAIVSRISSTRFIYDSCRIACARLAPRHGSTVVRRRQYSCRRHGRTESVVDIAYRHTRRTAVQHRQQCRESIKTCTVANTCRHGDDWHAYQPAHNGRQRTVHACDDNYHRRAAQCLLLRQQSMYAGDAYVRESRHSYRQCV